MRAHLQTWAEQNDTSVTLQSHVPGQHLTDYDDPDEGCVRLISISEGQGSLQYYNNVGDLKWENPPLGRTEKFINMDRVWACRHSRRLFSCADLCMEDRNLAESFFEDTLKQGLNASINVTDDIDINVGDYRQQRLSDVQSSILGKKEFIQQKKEELEEAYLELEELLGEMEYLKDTDTLNPIRKLQSLNSYEEFRVKGEQTILGITTPVQIREVHLGKYMVEYDISTSRLLVHPYQNNVINQGVTHPHVRVNGVPCWGNFSNTITKLCGKQKIPQLFTLVRHFLSQYNPQDPIVSIKMFQEGAQ